jgi:hypothetical protein
MVTTPTTTLNPLLTTPTTGQTYNPVTPEKLAQIAAQWQTMSPEARAAAERNQAAAIAAAGRVRARDEQRKQMAAAALQAKRDRYHEGLALQKRQEKEARDIQRKANLEDTKRQQLRKDAAQGERQRRIDRLATQRMNERNAKIKAANDKRIKDTAIATQRRTTQTNEANERKRQADAWRKAVRTGKSGAMESARQLFTDQGANFKNYSGQVDQAIRKIAAGLNPGEIPEAGTFENVGQDVYNRELNRGRNIAQQALEPHFGTGYEQRLLPEARLNPTITSIENEQFGTAQEYIDTLLNRGVITQPGYAKALQNLQGQRGKVNLQLQDIGKDILAGGRQELTDIGNQAGLQAGNLGLGQKFNVNPYAQQTAAAIKKFNQNLPGAFNTQIQGPLFDTTNLANIAGRASGGQNTAFDPYAIQGTTKPTQPLFPNDQVGMKSVF